MLNKFYGRGVCGALRDTGLVKFANDEIATDAADAVSEAVLPEEMPEEVGPEATAALADNLMELSQALEAGADSAEAAAVAAKSASANPAMQTRVKNAASWLRSKIAEGEGGTTITGTKPDQVNELTQSPTGEARMDEQNRPGGDAYANVGVGGVGTQQALGQGAIGSEKDHPGSMGPVDVPNSNSAIEAIKGASLNRLIAKLAQGGTTLMPGAALIPDAATGEGNLDDANRPGYAGYANMGVTGVGESDEAAKERAAAVGIEGVHPGTMGPVGQGGTNTAIQQIPGTKQSSAEQAYLRNFQEVANKYAAYLPPRLSQAEKVAALKYLLSQEPIMRDKLALYMQKTAEMPAGLAEYVAKEKGENKDEDEKSGSKENGNGEEKGEKENGEEKTPSTSDILSKVRNLVANA